MARAKKNASGPTRVLQKWHGTGPGLPKHPRVEPRAGPGLGPTHPYKTNHSALFNGDAMLIKSFIQDISP